jgi:oligopeptide transport system permease protein
VSYVIKRLFFLFFSLFVVITLTFILMQLIPGDPFTQEQAIPEEILQSLKAHYGLDKPLIVQYWNYLKGIATADFGPSFKYEGRSVTAIIAEGFPVSAQLGLESLTLSIFFGILLGSIAALYRAKWQDHAAMSLAVIGISVPNFIMATFLQYFIAMKLDLLPVARWGSFAHTILPAIALSALPTAFIARLTRTNMVEVLEQDYILTARAKGLPMSKIVLRHALKNSITPVIAYLGPLSSMILTGSFIIEKIFGIPGLGGWFVMSVMNRDYTVIMGVTVFYSALLMVMVFLVDMLSLALDPRLRHEREVTL